MSTDDLSHSTDETPSEKDFERIVTLASPHYASTWETGLKNARHDATLADGEIIVRGQVFVVHRSICSIFSKYLLNEFTKSSTVIINDISPNVMDCLLDYFYSNHIAIGEHNLRLVLVAANLLEIESLQIPALQDLEKRLFAKEKRSIGTRSGDTLGNILDKESRKIPDASDVSDWSYISPSITVKLKCGSEEESVCSKGPDLDNDNSEGGSKSCCDVTRQTQIDNVQEKFVQMTSPYSALGHSPNSKGVACNPLLENKVTFEELHGLLKTIADALKKWDPEQLRCFLSTEKKTANCNPEGGISLESQNNMPNMSTLKQKLQKLGTKVSGTGNFHDVPAWIFSSKDISLSPVGDLPEKDSSKLTPSRSLHKKYSPDTSTPKSSRTSSEKKPDLVEKEERVSPFASKTSKATKDTDEPVFLGERRLKYSPQTLPVKRNLSHSFGQPVAKAMTLKPLGKGNTVAKPNIQSSGIPFSSNSRTSAADGLSGRGVISPSNNQPRALLSQCRGRGIVNPNSTQPRSQIGSSQPVRMLSPGFRNRVISSPKEQQVMLSAKHKNLRYASNVEQRPLTDEGGFGHHLQSKVNHQCLQKESNRPDEANLRIMESYSISDSARSHANTISHRSRPRKPKHITSTPLVYQSYGAAAVSTADNSLSVTPKPKYFVKSDTNSEIVGVVDLGIAVQIIGNNETTTEVLFESQADEVRSSHQFDETMVTEISEQKDKSPEEETPVQTSASFSSDISVGNVTPPNGMENQEKEEFIGFDEELPDLQGKMVIKTFSTQEPKADEEESINQKSPDPEGAVKQHKKRNVKKRLGRKPMVHCCEVCKKRCFGRSALLMHKRIHDGEKVYRCSSCDYCSSVKKSMSKHTSRTHARAMVASERLLCVIPNVDPSEKKDKTTDSVNISTEEELIGVNEGTGGSVENEIDSECAALTKQNTVEEDISTL